MIIRGGKVLGGLTFGRVSLHTLGGEYCVTEDYFWLPDPAFPAFEDDSVLCSGLHQLDLVPVMLLKVGGQKPGPCTSKKCPGTSSDQRAYVGTSNSLCGC